MSQTIPAGADLGPAYTSLSIGYRVLNLDRTTYSAFSTTGVSESIAGQGFYVRSGGAVAPDAGGYIVWGTSGSDIIEDDIKPAAPTAADIDTQLSGTHGAGSWATATGFATPTNVSDAQTAILAAIPGTAAIASAVFAVAVETGHDLTTVLRAVYALLRGRSVADDGDNPELITYFAPDNSTVRVTHTLTDTERTVA